MSAIKSTTVGLRFSLVLVCLWLGIVSGEALDGAGQPQVNLLVVGDCGYSPSASRTPDQQNTARAMAEYASRGRIAVGAILLAGDTFKVKIAGPDDPLFGRAFEEMFDAQTLSMRFYAVFGNHDYQYRAVTAGLTYGRTHPDSRWKMPDRWYRLDLPAQEPLVTVLMLDSNRSELGKKLWQAQLGWIQEELSRPRQSSWTICLAHHPLFSNGQHGDDAALQAAWGPMMRKYRVDFYVSGHDHVLQHLQIPSWTISFLTSGGGGENTKRDVTGTHGPFTRAVHGFAAMEFGPLSAKVSLIDDQGRPLHVFERDRAGVTRILKTTPSDKP
jgi:tartrate-resistant acid phosphatase type 5